jgi:tripartite-type tricarboxylate transporter receptor subunit TctC
MKLEVPVAGTGPGLASVVYPTVLNNVLGTKFKVVPGYAGSTESMLAAERGEVDGALTSWNSLKTTQKAALSGTPNLLVQYTVERHAEMPQVPTMVELGQTAEKKSVLNLFASGAVVGRSLMAPPNLPRDHTKALRDAFQAMLRDQGFLDEVRKTQAELDPMPGEQLQKIIEDSLNVPSTVRQVARTARGL